MQIVPRELEIGPEEGFTPQKDIFGRKVLGDQLTRVVTALQSPCVLLLDAPWGTGKSTFVKMWRGELTKINIPTVYFDAFENDYQEDAFLAVASQIISEIQRLKPKHKRALEKFTTKAVSAAKVIGLASFRLGVRALTAGLVEAEDLEKAATEVVTGAGEEATKIVDDALRARLTSHVSDRKAFEGFRSALSELAHAVSPSENAGNDPQDKAFEGWSSHPLVIIIDELDRCRPNFALAVLEKIKHFFSVSGVIFVLVSSRSQLETAVTFAYGDIDARSYLEKFYHVRFMFPVGTIERPDMAVDTYLRHLGCNKNVALVIEQFSNIHPLSLRTLERIAICAKIAEASIPPRAFSLPQMISTLSILRVVFPSVYDKVRNSNIDFEELSRVLQFSKWRASRSNERSSLSISIERLWSYSLGEFLDEATARDFFSMLGPHNFEATQIIPYFCNFIDGFALPTSS